MALCVAWYPGADQYSDPSGPYLAGGVLFAFFSDRDLPADPVLFPAFSWMFLVQDRYKKRRGNPSLDSQMFYARDHDDGLVLLRRDVLKGLF